jgi:hypothetical protein
MTLGIQVFTWDRHNKWGWDKLVNLIPALLLLIIGSPTEMHIQINDKKTIKDSLKLKQSTDYCKHE